MAISTYKRVIALILLSILGVLVDLGGLSFKIEVIHQILRNKFFRKTAFLMLSIHSRFNELK